MNRGVTRDPSPVPNLASTGMLRDASAVITSLDAGMINVLGWTPDQMVGRASTEFLHPEDQSSAVAAWFAMLAAPGEARVWRGRYHGADGAWVWVETVNVNRLDDPDDPVVTTTMTRVAPDQVGVEEELRAPKAAP
jgi:PAS domain S-box-containing protein